MAGFRIEGNTSGNVAEVTAENRIKVQLTNDSSLPNEVGCVRVFAENDTGTFTGAAQNMSAETDLDFRQRQAIDIMLEQEQFNYTAQNTDKHLYRNTTMTSAWTVNGLQTNSGSIVTTTTGTIVQTYKTVPLLGTSTIAIDIGAAFDAQPTANTVIDIGAFLANSANPYAPTDGVYLRLTSAGLQGVINYNGTETTTSVFGNLESGAPYTNNKKYQFIIYATQRYIEWWYNDGTDPTATFLLGKLSTPVGNGQPFMSSALPVSVRHVITGGAAGAAIRATVSCLNVRQGGFMFSDTLSRTGARCYGSYTGLSGGTMGSTAAYANSTNPTSAAGSNTAANVTGLGGQGAINAAAAAATDFIMCSYQNPAASVNGSSRRLAITGCKMSFANLGAAVATTATTIACSIAFGHTAVSLATAEAATTKAPRRIAMGFAYWNVGAPIGATPQNGDLVMKFDNPIYVNPGEFIAGVMKFVTGTATASQSIWYHVTFDVGPE